MNREIDRLVQNIVISLDDLRMLEISGNRWNVVGENAHYSNTSYPEFDLCQAVLKGDYNLIIAEFIFEHLPYPYRAGRNVYQMLSPGGFFLITVPFMYPMHNHPMDCTRWTKTGLKYFLIECGFDEHKIYTESWGNKDCVNAHVQYMEPINYDEKIHSLENDPLMPISVWAVAQK